MNPYASRQAYQESTVLTASPEQLVVMLYDGAIRFLRQADLSMSEEAWQYGMDRLTRADAIIDELLVTLNMDAGELSERLQAIYIFCKKCLIEARIERNAEKVRQVIALLSDLRGAWAGLAARATAPQTAA